MTPDTDIGTPDPRIWYQARDGKVYDEEGNEAATARTANGRDLERHAEALETAKRQRAAIERGAKMSEGAAIVRAAGSHHLELTHGKITKEELFPIVELKAPRVGKVRATFSADRYEHSSGWSEWRIYARDIRTPDAERPDLPHLGREAAGIGPATRDAINEAGRPLIEEWLTTPAYQQSRQMAAARAVSRVFDAPPDYRIREAARLLEAVRDELTFDALDGFEKAIGHLERARAAIDRATGDRNA